MAGKRALIVDDSRAARAFLARILEGYGLGVDAVESAEDAIEYLGRHHPDVIFMDHLMPGMDGFQAVQAIKNDPRTVTIPIMMYTSQEGELYLGQARALGAVGVLPKQIKPADVSKVLYQLRLVPDRRSGEQHAFHEEGAAAAAAPTPAEGLNLAAEVAIADIGNTAGTAATASPAVVNETLVRDQIAELRRFVVANLEQHTERLLTEMRTHSAELQAAVTPLPLPPEPAQRAGGQLLAWAAAVAGIVFGGVMFGLWRQEASLRKELQAQVAAPATGAPQLATLVPADAASQPGDAPPEASRESLLVEQVPYGEPPLAGARIEHVRTIVAPLLGRGFQGSVRVSAYPGRFCLSGNAAEGYSLAPDDMRYASCDVVGGTGEVGGSQLESLAFANMISDLRKRAAGSFDITVDAGAADTVAQPYPRASAALTAGEWNRAAAANNRVEVRLQP